MREETLLECCVKVLNGRGAEAELRSALEKERGRLELLREDFSRGAKAFEPEVREASSFEEESVMGTIDYYLNVLHPIEEYLKNKERLDLVRGAEMVRRAAMNLNTALLAHRNKVLYAMGPTDIPNLNLFLKCQRELKAGKMPSERFQEIVEMTRQEIAAARNALRHGASSPEREALAKAYDRHNETMDIFRQYIREKKEELLDRGIDLFKKICEEIKELLPLVGAWEMTSHPTPSPEANLVINLAQSLIDGKRCEEELVSALGNLERSFARIQREFETLASTPLESVLVSDEIASTREGFTLYQNAVEDFHTFLEGREQFRLEHGISKLKEAVSLLHRSFETYKEISEREGKILCVRCNHFTPPGKRNCEKCGAVLPRIMEPAPSTFQLKEMEEMGGIVLTDNLVKVLEAVNRAGNGEISDEEFLKTIQWMEKIVKDGEQGYKPPPRMNLADLPPDQQEGGKMLKQAIEEGVALFHKGTKEMLEGLSTLKKFLDDHDREHLSSGAQLLWSGSGKLTQVQKITAQAVQDAAKRSGIAVQPG